MAYYASNALNPPQLLSVVSHRPGRVQHGGLTTMSAQVVTNQSCRREMDEDPLRQTRLFCLWTSYMEQSSSSGPQHWQLSSVQTSSQVTSVSSCFYWLTFILFSIPTQYAHYPLLTIVMNSRPCFYDWALEHFFIIIIIIITVSHMHYILHKYWKCNKKCASQTLTQCNTFAADVVASFSQLPAVRRVLHNDK